MNEADRQYFDEKFDKVHSRITDAEKASSTALHLHSADDMRNFSTLGNQIATLTATRCRDVVEHENKFHDALKLWSLIAALVAAASGIGAGLGWLLRHI